MVSIMTHWLFLLSLVFTQDEFFIIKLACALFCHSQFGFARLSEWIFVRFSGVKRVSKLGKFIQGWPSLLDPKVWTGVFDTQKTATQGISKGPFNQIVLRQIQITSLWLSLIKIIQRNQIFILIWSLLKSDWKCLKNWQIWNIRKKIPHIWAEEFWSIWNEIEGYRSKFLMSSKIYTLEGSTIFKKSRGIFYWFLNYTNKVTLQVLENIATWTKK